MIDVSRKYPDAPQSVLAMIHAKRVRACRVSLLAPVC